MLSYSEYAQLDAIAASEGIRRGDFTSSELIHCALERAQAINPAVNAIVHENYDKAVEQAKRFDTQASPSAASPVAGIPFLIKDLAEVAGLPTSYGSKLYANYVSASHSNIVARYVDAGLNIFGKTNTPEFGLTITTEAQANGACHNPWNLDYSTGGSSGGAAAAVAAGILPVAHASDGGGSIRIPASCCGLFGHKPSRGLTVVGGTESESWGGMSVGHVLSRSVRDSAAFLDIIKLERPHLYPCPPSPLSFYDALTEKPDNSPLRIAVQYAHPSGEEVDEQCLAAVRRAAQLCEELGHRIEEAPHPVDHLAVGKAMSKLINTFSFQSVSGRAKTLNMELQDAPLETSTKAMAMRGEGVSAADYLAARECLAAGERQLADFHKLYDVILQPVLSKTPAKLGWLDMNADDLRSYGSRYRSYGGFTAMANGSGQPSMSVPITKSPENLPIGALFTAAWGEDLTLLRLAQQLEQVVKWPGLATL